MVKEGNKIQRNWRRAGSSFVDSEKPNLMHQGQLWEDYAKERNKVHHEKGHAVIREVISKKKPSDGR